MWLWRPDEGYLKLLRKTTEVRRIVDVLNGIRIEPLPNTTVKRNLYAFARVWKLGFGDSRLIDGGEVVSPTHRPRFTLQKYYSVSGTQLF
jgi:hypothetical protein